MIIDDRPIDMMESVDVPQPGDLVATREGQPRTLLKVKRYWPRMRMWEATVAGVRKDEVKVTIHKARIPGCPWAEVPAR